MSVYKAINLVQADLCKHGIGKDSVNEGQRYMFRGIDAVYNAISPLLAKHGLCILPRMISRTCEKHTSAKGGILFYVNLDAEFDFVSVEDGSKHTVRTFGEAMDSGDKATNKAMSAAFKYAVVQTFAIPTEGDNDADATTHEVKAEKPAIAKAITVDVWDSLTPEKQAELQSIADTVRELMATDMSLAYGCLQDVTEDDDKTALWSRFDSKERTALKRFKQVESLM